MSKMVVLPKIPLYIGWLVCVLVIPVGHENEKGLAPDNGGLVGRTNTPCLVQKQGRGCLFWAYSGGHRAGERLPLFRGCLLYTSRCV